jgi:hypothetical protein
LSNASLIIDRGSLESEKDRRIFLRFSESKQVIISQTIAVFPSIKEGITKCREIEGNLITVMPYLLFSGIRLKGFVSATW